MRTRRKWEKYTPDQKSLLKEFVYGHSYREIQAEFAKRFDIMLSFDEIKGYIGNNHLTTGRTGGKVIPWNKGIHYHPKGLEKTQFKKGNVPPQHREVGSERVDSKDGYTSIKVAEPNVWKLKHRWIWEQAHGPIPKDYIVIFKDGDRTHIELDNLMMVKRSWNIRVNQDFPNIDPELIETVYKYAELKTTINEKIKKG